MSTITFDISTINISIELFGLLICLTVILCRNFLVGFHQQKLKMRFTQLAFGEALFLFSAAMCGLLMQIRTPAASVLLKIFYFLRLMFIYVLTGIFTEYMICFFHADQKKLMRTCIWGLILISTATLFINLFVPFFYSIDSNNRLIPTVYFQLSLFPCVLISILNLIYVICRKSKVSALAFTSFLFYIIVPVSAIMIQILFVQLDIVSIALILVMMYMFVVMQNRFVHEYIEQEKELQESRTRLMISQVRPHFIFNSLTSIAQLCDEDPAEAKNVTIAFANYLRGNLTSLEKTEPIPFSDELNHIRNYLKIEKTRFGDFLNIVYDIETEDFRVPALSIQPLVENAVKHGVGMKEDGGTVTISVHAEDGQIVLAIRDDGIGFDTSKEMASDTGIGIRNSTERLKLQCQADVRIESTPGTGTCVTITFPAGQEGASL